jgi:hypothetical protein
VSLQNFTLLAKLEALDLAGHKICKRFEKSEKHVLSAEIRHTNAQILHLVIRAAKTQLEERRVRRPLIATRELLWKADVELEYLRLQVRKSFALRLVNDKTYEDWSRLIHECGGMLGAWVKKVNENVDKAQGRAAAPAQNRLL